MENNGDHQMQGQYSMGHNGDERRERIGKYIIVDNRQENSTSSLSGTYSRRSPLTMATLARILENPWRRAPWPGSTRYYFDNTARPLYGWLLPGWIAEERTMETGRLYRYFYDPSGYQYRTLYEVLNAWEEAGLILLEM